MAKDYYATLGVSRTASDEEIKRAFRKLAHLHHPDKAGGDADTFKEINEAYQVLGNKEKRARYDQFGTAEPGGPGFGGASWQDFTRQGGFNGTMDFNTEDIGDLFGDLFGFGTRRQTRRGRQRGSDLRTEVTITLEETAFGTERLLDLRKRVSCPHCKGNGAEPGTKITACDTCGGSGQVAQVRSTILGQIQTVAVCPTCRGEGKVPERRCSTCGGDGVVRDTKRLRVTIPAGIEDGQSVRLTGEGEAGERGAPAGDLYLTVRIQPHASFERDGEDIRSTVTLSFSQAALGAKVPVHTLHGEVLLAVPTGTQSGKTFRLRGKGMARLHGRGFGDHLATVHVETPTKLTRKAKQLLDELSKELS